MKNNAFTQEVDNVALSSNDDKRLEAFDEIASYLFGADAGKICKI